MTYIPRRTGFLSALALVFALTACGDSTGPLLGTGISVSVALLEGPTMLEEVPGERRIRCAVTFRATADGGERATWQDATFKFFTGPDRAARDCWPSCCSLMRAAPHGPARAVS